MARYCLWLINHHLHGLAGRTPLGAYNSNAHQGCGTQFGREGHNRNPCMRVEVIVPNYQRAQRWAYCE